MTRADRLVWILILTGCSGLTRPDPDQIYAGPAEPEDAALPTSVERTVSDPVAGWRWVDLPETVCRDGSSTGIAVNAPDNGIDADKLLIFLNGGNACLNTGCMEQITPSHFTEADWDRMLCKQLGDCSVDIEGEDVAAKWDHEDDTWLGVLDAHPDNPFAEWTKVFVPYCSGDWHGGENPEPIAIGSGESVFMGAANTRVSLAALRDELGTDFDKVLLTGASAGGIGAILNHDEVADLYGPERTYLLSDAGPAYTDAYVPACMQSRLKNLWRLDRGLPALDGCPGETCAWNEDAWMDQRWTWMLDTYSRGPAAGPVLAGSRMGLVVSGSDSKAAGMFDMMANECDRLDDLYIPSSPPYAQVEAATHALRTDVFDTYHGVKIFHVEDATEHMWMQRKPWWTLSFAGDTGEVALVDWVGAMLDEDPGWDHALVSEIPEQALPATSVSEAVQAAAE